MKPFLILSTFCVGLISADLSAAERTAVEFAIGEWEPFTGENLTNYGLATEIVTAACEAAGISPKYEFFPWERAEDNVLNGTQFATFPYGPNEEREQKFLFSETFVTSSDSLLFKLDAPKTRDFRFSKIEDLKGFTIGIIAGSDYDDLGEAGATIVPVPTGEQNIKKLKLGRIDFFVDDHPVLYRYLEKTLPAEEINQYGFIRNIYGELNNYKLMVSRQYPNSQELLSRFNHGLEEIKRNGEYKRILDRYGLLK